MSSPRISSSQLSHLRLLHRLHPMIPIHYSFKRPNAPHIIDPTGTEAAFDICGLWVNNLTETIKKDCSTRRTDRNESISRENTRKRCAHNQCSSRISQNIKIGASNLHTGRASPTTRFKKTNEWYIQKHLRNKAHPHLLHTLIIFNSLSLSISLLSLIST